MCRCRYSGNRRNANGPENVKPASVKTLKDLTNVFHQDVEKLTGSCRVVIIAFQTYYDISLKNSTRSGRPRNAVLVEFAVDNAFGTIDASLIEILSHTRTKQQLTSFFGKKLPTYLEQKDIHFINAGKGSTVMSWGEQSSSNHVEDETCF